MPSLSKPALLFALLATIGVPQLSSASSEGHPARDGLAVVPGSAGPVALERDPAGGLRIVSPVGVQADAGTPLAGTKGDASWLVATGTASRLMAAWVESTGSGSRIMAAEILDGRAGPAVQVSSAAARWCRFPAIAETAEGETWIAWVDGSMETDGIVASHGRAGRFSPPEVVSGIDTSEDLVPQVGFDRVGSTVVVWAGLDGHDDEILWSRRGADGTWSREARIHADNAVPDITPSLARDGHGVLHVAWSMYEADGYQVMTSPFDGRAWGPAVRVSPGTGAATLPRAVADGDAVVILWNQFDGRGSLLGASRVTSDGMAQPIEAKSPIPLWYKPAAARSDVGIQVLLPEGDGLRAFTLPARASR